jgi:hypothetical protein
MEINCILNNIQPLYKDTTALRVHKIWITEELIAVHQGCRLLCLHFL